MTVNNQLNTGGGTLLVLAGTINGSGTVGGDLNNDGGIISPGNSLEAASVVPEPGTCLLTAVGLLCLLAGYQRHRNSC